MHTGWACVRYCIKSVVLFSHLSLIMTYNNMEGTTISQNSLTFNVVVHQQQDRTRVCTIVSVIST